METQIDNLDEIARAMFTKPPGDVRSIQLQLEEETADIATYEGVDSFVFNILFLLTYKGMQILFGLDNFMHLQKTQFDLLQKYMNSAGYRIIVCANDTQLSPWETIANGDVVRSYKIVFADI
uniref:Uncharacterized protein n=1 Tax=viral metagenome TaxID=1070528 RepID=A0A6C0DZE9_9ZZZZ